MSDTQTPTYWSEDGQIFYCDGKGYGLLEDGRTVCVKEKEMN